MTHRLSDVNVSLTFFLLFAALLIMSTANAKTSYVSDDLSINLRSGKSSSHKIIKLLNSGDSIEVLSDAGDGYTQVRTEGGTTGWVLTRFLSNQPSAQVRLLALEEKYAALDKNFEQEVEKRLRDMNDELSELRRTAASQIQLSRDNSKLRTALAEQSAEKEKLVAENTLLQDQNKRKWFITGTVVTLGSLFLGLIIPRIPWRKRRRWDEL